MGDFQMTAAEVAEAFPEPCVTAASPLSESPRGGGISAQPRAARSGRGAGEWPRRPEIHCAQGDLCVTAASPPSFRPTEDFCRARRKSSMTEGACAAETKRADGAPCVTAASPPPEAPLAEGDGGWDAWNLWNLWALWDRKPRPTGPNPIQSQCKSATWDYIISSFVAAIHAARTITQPRSNHLQR